MAVKIAAARANARAGALEGRLGGGDRRIGEAPSCRRAIHAQFPVHRLHGGGGTSANMNANEVLANLAEESARRSPRRVPDRPPQRPRQPQPVDQRRLPDGVPRRDRHALARTPADGVVALVDAFAAKPAETGAVPRLARTCLQDAVAGEWGQLFGAYGALRSCVRLRARRRGSRRVSTRSTSAAASSATAPTSRERTSRRSSRSCGPPPATPPTARRTISSTPRRTRMMPLPCRRRSICSAAVS